MVPRRDLSSPLTPVDTAGKGVAGSNSAVEAGEEYRPVTKEQHMRVRMTGLVLGLGLLVLGLVLAATGCGGASKNDGIATAGGHATATGSAGGGLSDQDKMLKFAQCMRGNGVPNFPDPQANQKGGVNLTVPDGSDPTKVDAAMKKCRQYMPGGGEGQKADPQVVEQLRKFSQCMREHGIPNFPDPTDEGLQVDNDKLGLSGPDDPKLKAAQDACNKLMPRPSGSADAGAGAGPIVNGGQ
jgi:hypothetical protein